MGAGQGRQASRRGGGGIHEVALPAGIGRGEAALERNERRGIAARIAAHWQFLLGLTSILVIGGAWQLCADLHVVDAFFTSSPSQIVVAEFHYFHGGNGLRDVATTGKEFIIGIALSVVVGVPLGLVTGYYRFAGAACEPLVNLLYQTPFIALAPVMILWFGIGLDSKVALAFAISVSPIVIMTSAGVGTVENSLLNVARTYRANDYQIFRTLILPGSIPAVISGLRLGTGLALVGTIAGEIVASSAGLGNTLTAAEAAQQASLILAVVVVLAVFGMAVSIALRLVGERVDKWRVA
jgi:ABC-type nitrate/sulfonate/bicarbonate transport system permease component